jgi:hypothetical protein
MNGVSGPFLKVDFQSCISNEPISHEFFDFCKRNHGQDMLDVYLLIQTFKLSDESMDGEAMVEDIVSTRLDSMHSKLLHISESEFKILENANKLNPDIFDRIETLLLFQLECDFYDLFVESDSFRLWREKMRKISPGIKFVNPIVVSKTCTDGKVDDSQNRSRNFSKLTNEAPLLHLMTHTPLFNELKHHNKDPISYFMKYYRLIPVIKSYKMGKPTLYVIEVTIEDETYEIEKRYSEMLAFHEKLLSLKLKLELPTFPGKSYGWTNKSIKSVEDRMNGLNVYFGTISKQIKILVLDEYQEFFAKK